MTDRTTEKAPGINYLALCAAVALYALGVIAYTAWHYVGIRKTLQELVEPAHFDVMIPRLNSQVVVHGILTLGLALPVIFLFNRIRIKASRKQAELNRKMQRDMEKLAKQDAELKDAMDDLKRFNALAAGRETRIIELKTEVNALLAQQDKAKRYNVEYVE